MRERVLTLRFVNCQGVGEAEGKLDTTEFDTLTTDLGVEVNSWREDDRSMRGEELNLDNTRHENSEKIPTKHLSDR